MTTSGWIGVDLDGTLAEYHGWGDGSIGKPVPAMVQRVRQWLADGIEVRIFTARVGMGAGYSSESQMVDNLEFAEKQRKLIETWCKENIGVELPVTSHKDFRMFELWDDRCVRVEMNTGRVL